MVGAVEVAVRLMCAPAVAVEDVGAGPVCGCYQKSQTNQLFENPSRSAMVRATIIAIINFLVKLLHKNFDNSTIRFNFASSNSIII